MEKRFSFPHGLGDCVNARGLIRQLTHFHKDWDVAIGVRPGCQPLFEGICRAFDIGDLSDATEIPWHECHQIYGEGPATKREKSLREQFSLIPDANLPEPKMLAMADQATTSQVVEDYLSKVTKNMPREAGGRFATAVVHFRGNTSGERKNIGGTDPNWILEMCRDEGLIPIVLDWNEPPTQVYADYVYHPGVGHEIWGEYPHGHAGRIWQLIEKSSLFIGIDSGPGHVARLASTPSILVWHGHHPIHYAHPTENTYHFCNPQINDLIRGDRSTGRRYFEKNFKHRYWHSFLVDLQQYVRDIRSNVSEDLEPKSGIYCRKNMKAQDHVIVQDVYEGDCYKIQDVPVRREVFFDIGAHVGCASRKFHDRNHEAKIVCVEVAPENLPALRQNVGEFALIIQAACTYEKEELGLLNAVYEGCASTGGSTVVTKEQATEYKNSGVERRPQKPGESGPKREYWSDLRPLKKVTLEQLMTMAEVTHIDMLKLDCEGSEHSILRGCEDKTLARIGRIVGEFHGKEAFLQLVADRFDGWGFRTDKTHNDIGLFWLTNPQLVGR